MASERDKAKSATQDPEENDPEYEAKIAEGKAKADAINRESGLQGHLHKVTVCGVYLIGSLIIIAVSIWLYHFMVPTNWWFLNPDQIENLQKILFSGFIGGALGGQAKKISK